MNQQEFMKEAKIRALEVTKRTGSTMVVVQYALCYKDKNIDDMSPEECESLSEDTLCSDDLTYEILGAEPFDTKHPKEGHFVLLSVRQDLANSETVPTRLT